MKNNRWQTFLLVLFVVIVLLGLFYLPQIKFFGIELRQVNILCDVQNRSKESNILAEIDSLCELNEQNTDTMPAKIKDIVYVDSIPAGMIAIEDFADVQGITREMDYFYSALNETGIRPVRIAYFGDSYIEGDILTMDLRGLLQQKYGGLGCGFVEIQSVTSGFRQTIITKRTGWNTYHANEYNRGFNVSLQSIAGSYFIPNSSASYEMRGTKSIYPNQLDTAEVATVYFTPGERLSINYTINDNRSQPMFSKDMSVKSEIDKDSVMVCETDSIDSYIRQEPQSQIRTSVVKGRIGRFGLQISEGVNSRFYGVAFDGCRGISVDNFSMRSSSGLHLHNIPQNTMKSFAAVRPYDLIILHYGLNVASSKQKNYSTYASHMGKVVQHLKDAYPHASILIISVSDRDTPDMTGEMHTMAGVQELITYQRKIANEQHVAFWNLYKAMRGDGSIARMVEKRQANKDYTHINAAGGRYLAKLLFDVLINGKENYDKRTH